MKYQVYVINLDKDVERMRFMHTQLTMLGIDYVRIPAVYGKEIKDISEVYDEALAEKHNGKQMHVNEIGCALSHKKVYTDFLKLVSFDTTKEYVLVLEDDVRLPDNFKNILDQQIDLNVKSQKWEYLLFDYVMPGITMLSFWIRSIPVALHQRKNNFKRTFIFLLLLLPKFVAISTLSLFEGLRNLYYQTFKKEGAAVRFYRSLYLAGCYMVHAQGVQKMLSLTEKVIYPADRLPDEARKQGMKFYAYAPLCVKQMRHDFGSSLLGLSGEQMQKGEEYTYESK